MAALPYMQLYVADYLADTAHLTAAQNGAYLLLMFNYWQRGKPLNNANERLANVARMTSEEWTINKPFLEEFFIVDGDEWKHTRIDRDLQAVMDKSTKASNSGKASANKRSANAQRTFNHTDTDVDTDRLTDPLLDSSKVVGVSPAATPTKKSGSKGERLDPEWRLPVEWGLSAMKENAALTREDVRKEAAKFRDHWIAKSGKDACKTDWEATWRNWMRSDFIKPSGSAPAGSSDNWFMSASGIEGKAASLGIEHLDGELFPQFKSRVFEAAGVTEDMVRKAKADCSV